MDRHDDDRQFDARLRQVARDATAAVERAVERSTDGAELKRRVDHAPVELKSATNVMSSPRWHRWLGAAAVVLALAVGLVWVAGRDQLSIAPANEPVDHSTPFTQVEATERPTSAPPSTAVAAPMTTPPATASGRATETPPVVVSTPDSEPPTDVADLWFEGTDIGWSACDSCQQIRHAFDGSTVVWNSETGSLSRHGDEVTTVDLDLVEAWFIAVGPDDVAYFSIPDDSESSTIVGVSLAADDFADEVSRQVGVLSGDADIVVAPTGLVRAGWHSVGDRPLASAPTIVEWRSRDSSPDVVAPRVVFDAIDGEVAVDDRRWSLPADLAYQWGVPPITPTFDGGFVAVFADAEGFPTRVLRGWPEGDVASWVIPSAFDVKRAAVAVDRSGRVLLPYEGAYVRVAAFDPPHSEWGGTSTVDLDTFSVDYPGLQEALVSQPMWATDPVAFGDALAGPLNSPAERRRVSVNVDDNGAATVLVTTDHFLDDSGFGERLQFDVVVSDGRVVDLLSTSVAFRCQPNRGQQTYEERLCI